MSHRLALISLAVSSLATSASWSGLPQTTVCVPCCFPGETREAACAVSERRAVVMDTPKGRVEFIGLERWSPGMIQEKLGYKSPDELHFCAADLKTKLGFTDASVIVYREEGKRYTVITVVEPQHADQVQYRSQPAALLPSPAEWNDLLQIVEQKKFLNGLLDYGSTLKNARKAGEWAISDEDTSWWKTLQQQRSEQAYQLALKRLAEDGDYRNRVAAAMILLNFADRDLAWQALMEGVRDPNDLVQVTCSQALITLTKYVPRAVDWTPALPAIHAILNGTNLGALPFVLDTLLATYLSARLAKPLLGKGGGRMVLAYLKAGHERERNLAHRLLIRLSGRDFGYDSSRWEAWIARL